MHASISEPLEGFRRNANLKPHQRLAEENADLISRFREGDKSALAELADKAATKLADIGQAMLDLECPIVSRFIHSDEPRDVASEIYFASLKMSYCAHDLRQFLRAIFMTPEAVMETRAACE